MFRYKDTDDRKIKQMRIWGLLNIRVCPLWNSHCREAVVWPINIGIYEVFGKLVLENSTLETQSYVPTHSHLRYYIFHPLYK